MTDQERLANIKKSFGGRWIHLDIKWLIEKVEEQQKEFKELDDMTYKEIKSLKEEIQQLETELMMLR